MSSEIRLNSGDRYAGPSDHGQGVGSQLNRAIIRKIRLLKGPDLLSVHKICVGVPVGVFRWRTKETRQSFMVLARFF